MRFHNNYGDNICYTPDKYRCESCKLIIMVGDICRHTYYPFMMESKSTINHYHRECFEKDQL